jgi:hypothetical protein
MEAPAKGLLAADRKYTNLAGHRVGGIFRALGGVDRWQAGSTFSNRI